MYMISPYSKIYSNALERLVQEIRSSPNQVQQELLQFLNDYRLREQTQKDSEIGHIQGLQALLQFTRKDGRKEDRRLIAEMLRKSIRSYGTGARYPFAGSMRLIDWLQKHIKVLRGPIMNVPALTAESLTVHERLASFDVILEALMRTRRFRL